MTWTTAQLGDVATLELGKMLDQEKNKGDLRPYLANINVRWGKFDLAGLREMRFEPHEIDRFSLKKNDIVMCEGGEPGRCAIWKDDAEGMMFQKALHRIRPGELLDSSFLFYAFLHLGMSNGFSQYFTGSTIKHLPREQLAKLVVRFPDLSTQQSISGILERYDDLIENNRRRIALLEESARLLYREWFVDLRFPGHESLVVTNGIPDGWALCALSSVVEINPKTLFEKDKLSPFVPMQALSETSMVMSAPEARSISGGAKFQNGDTLLARITPCLENGKTGFVQFLADETPVASGSTEFIVLRSLRVNPYWVYCLAREDSFRRHAIASMAGADGRQRVNTKCFDAYVVLQPPVSVLFDFASRVEPCFSQIQHLSDMNDRLQEARNALLPKLMSGEIAV